MESKYKVALMHVSPVFLDTKKTIDKVCSLIEEASSKGARLIVFPETFVSAFPIWSALRAPIYNHKWFNLLAAQTVHIDGPEVARVCEYAKKHEVFVSLGINEGTKDSVGCIWNSNLLIDSHGQVINHHRKLVPTYWEKLVWANGDGAGLRVSDTSLGRIGMLICGENFNPLSRFSLIAQGEQLHISSYPPVWPAYDPKNGVPWSVAEGIKIRAGAHALEAKVYNLACAAYMDNQMRDLLADGDSEAARILDESPRGMSLVMDPMARTIGEPIQNSEGILYADVDLQLCTEAKQLHDLSGYYNRFDIFELRVNRSRNRPANFLDDSLQTGLPLEPLD
jgi:aliphatic nitrilase